MEVIEQIADYIGYALVIAGVFFMLTGSIGILRFGDFFTRLHPAGVTDSLGAPLTLLGLVLIEGFSLVTLKLILLILLVYITAPTACHALAKAANHTLHRK